MKAYTEEQHFTPVCLVLETKQEALTVITALQTMAGDFVNHEARNRVEKMAQQIAEAAGL